MKNSKNDKIQLITHKTLIIGVDIAKRVQWAQFTDYRGLEVSKHLKFNNDLTGFKSIIQKIEEIKKNKDFSAVIVGMEPTGHYWKPLGAFLENSGIKVVLVNPAHTKKSKELDDNSQTKNDRKDALTIAKLVKDGRYSEMYLPKEEYSELRALTLTRIEVSKTQNSTKNRIRALMDEYFPEFETVFKTFIEGKAALHLLKNCPFPQDVLKLKELEIQELLKEVVKKTVGIKKIKELQNVAKTSVGITLGIEGAKVRLKVLLENYEQNVKHLELIENEMEKQLQKTGYLEVLTSIPGVGIVSASSFLGEIGNPKRFSNPQQIVRLAGYNLVENSSGLHKSKTSISKRGRKNLRSILYKMALVLVCKNKEMKTLYNYLRTREKNPLKQKQALVVIAEKAVRVMFNLMINRNNYDETKVLGEFRLKQIAA
jgi:Transposase and inactivated derivatives